MYLQRINSLSFEEIQKYNGKSVKTFDLINVILDDKNLFVVFKISSIKASEEIKVRAFLKKYKIKTKRFKRKNISFFEMFVNYPPCEKSNFSNFLKFMEGSGLILVFNDFLHFFFFEKFLLPKLLKVRFFPVLFKTNNQYLFSNSTSLENTLNNIKENNCDFKRLNSFFFFQFSTIRNFLYFYIFFSYQLQIYNKIL